MFYIWQVLLYNRLKHFTKRKRDTMLNIQKEYIRKALSELQFNHFTEVQERVIPMFMQHKNIVVEAKTGSGKTHSYLIPIFEGLNEDLHQVQALICAPTRDLANQIYEFARQIANFSTKTIDVRLFVGGRDREVEIDKLSKTQPQIVIGTPGRLYDLVRKENLLKAFTSQVMVIDEADMALEDEFLQEIDGIASTMGKELQLVVFSATVPVSIQPFLKKYLIQPEFIQVQKEDIANLNIKHYFIKTKERDRIELLKDILSAINPYIGIIFCNKKESAEQVYAFMNEAKYKVALLHGGMDYRKRKQILSRVKALDYQYLVATDIMSRGIDIDGVSHIINFELPKDNAFYIHRTGRTGRMLYDGIAISLYDFQDESYLDQLEQKGLKGVYKEIKNREIVDARERNQRENRPKQSSVIEKKAQVIAKDSQKVKPGYKKKYQQKVEKVKKQLSKRSGKY